MKPNRYLEILVISAFVFLLGIYLLDLYELNHYTVIRKAVDVKEAMVDLIPAEVKQPYSLLDGVLPLKDKQSSSSLNSQTCFEGDFQSRLEKTGNYIQRTNNYVHKDAESCSSPLQEFVTAYYKVDPLN